MAIRLIPNTPSPTTAGATLTATRATTTAPSPTQRGDPADPKYAFAYNGGATRTAPKAQRPRHHRLQRGDPADPKFAFAYNGRGNAPPRQGRHQPRHRLQRGDPARSQIRLAYNNRGSAYCAKGDTDRAITDYNEAIRLDPKFASPTTAGAAYRQGRQRPHITDYNEAIRLDPKFALAYYNRGNVYETKKDYDHATDFVMHNLTQRMLPTSTRAVGSARLAAAT